MTPGLRTRFFAAAAATADLGGGSRFSGDSGRVSALSVVSTGFIVDITGFREGFVATRGGGVEETLPEPSRSVSWSDSECVMASFCLLERRLASPANLLSAATWEELLSSSSSLLSSSLGFKSRYSLYFRTAISFSHKVENGLMRMNFKIFDGVYSKFRASSGGPQLNLCSSQP